MHPLVLFGNLQRSQAAHDKALDDLLTKVKLVLDFGAQNNTKGAEEQRVHMHEDLDKIYDEVFRLGMLLKEVNEIKRRLGL